MSWTCCAPPADCGPQPRASSPGAKDPLQHPGLEGAVWVTDFTLQHSARQRREGASPDSRHQLLPAVGRCAAATRGDLGSRAQGPEVCKQKRGPTVGPSRRRRPHRAVASQKPIFRRWGRDRAWTQRAAPATGHLLAPIFIVCAPAGCHARGAPSSVHNSEGVTRRPLNLWLPASCDGHSPTYPQITKVSIQATSPDTQAW